MSKRKTKIQKLAEQLGKLADEAEKAALLLKTKAGFAKACDANGASLESVCDKLGWKVERLETLLQPGTDIDMRSLSDMYFALGKQVHIKMEKPSP